jgi:hypothetical protein
MDSSRAWMLRLGTVGGLVALVGAAYTALRTPASRCLHSTSQRQYACEVPAPTHPHLELALLLAVVGVLILVGAAVVAGVWTESIWWRPPTRGARRLPHHWSLRGSSWCRHEHVCEGLARNFPNPGGVLPDDTV